MEQELDFSVIVPSKFSGLYSEILGKHGFQAERDGYYWKVGEAQSIQGWILDISCIYTQLENLLSKVLPFLSVHQIPFKLALDLKTARSIADGEYGYLLLGKVISVYPSNEVQALSIAQTLIEKTSGFKGPEIVTDRQLGNIVYTRYGATNPVIQINQMGIKEHYIYDPNGNLVEDPYSIPFQLPTGIDWPFTSITSPVPPKKETVLQDKYRPMAFLKEDTKGAVRKGLYLEKGWRVRWCVIKEGRRNVLSDSRERDATDRLRWQYDLQKDLTETLPIPKIFDLFEENGDAYLVMQFIKGQSLDRIAGQSLIGITWQQLPLKDKIRLINYASQAIDMIHKMHQRGYIHRDITAGNFLVDKRDKLWMIDLELAYSSSQNRPYPPFRLGTPGYMSPEQIETRRPTVAQDVYAFGALFIYLFTGLSPEKFGCEDPLILKEQLAFFLPSVELIEIIANCQQRDPKLRPSLPDLKAAINKFRDTQVSGSKFDIKSTSVSANRPKLAEVITGAIEGLYCKRFMNKSGHWLTRTPAVSGFSYGHDMSMSVYPEFYQGVSGILYTLSKAYKLGFSLGSSESGFENGFSYLQQKVTALSPEEPGGLYFGSSGIAMSLYNALSVQPTQNFKEILEPLARGLESNNTQGLGMAKGLAGKGMALLNIIELGDNPASLLLLDEIVEQLLDQQEQDGSWLTTSTRHQHRMKVTGFAHGVAGILCFLLAYERRFRSRRNVKEAAQKTLAWLMSKAYKHKGQLRWAINDQTKETAFDIHNGSLGVILSFIKAFEIYERDDYRMMAEGGLKSYPSDEISAELSHSNGLVGLGEVCLEGAKIFNDGHWQKRADWITEFLLHHFYVVEPGSYYWMPETAPFTTAGLMEGNSGIIYYLLRYHSPKILNHPLLA